MRAGPKPPAKKPPRDLNEAVDQRLAYDKRKSALASRRASDAADKLLADLDKVLKGLDRRP